MIRLVRRDISLSDKSPWRMLDFYRSSFIDNYQELEDSGNTEIVVNIRNIRACRSYWKEDTIYNKN